MCGIAAILRIHLPGDAPDVMASIPEAWVDMLDGSIAHRGPDGAARFRDRVRLGDGSVVDVVLAHRRLAIIDVEGGRQPMGVGTHGLLREGDRYVPGHFEECPGCEGDRLRVIFNGCIYNHRRLRAELESLGHEFRTERSDTEVLVHGWRQWRHELWPRLVGMFAVAIWDGVRGELHVGRDWAGEKPLYWMDREHPPDVLRARGEQPGVISLAALASTASGLARLPWGQDHRLVGSATRDGWQTVTHDWVRFGAAWGTPLPRIGALPPGRGATCGRDAPSRGVRSLVAHGVVPGRWWVEPKPPLMGGRLGNLDKLDAMVRAAVHDRLESEAPLGVFLSGGIDSSLITAYAREALPEIRAFTLRMPDARLDESPHATLVAQRLGVRHEILQCPRDVASDLVKIITTAGVPLADSSVLPTYWLCKGARREVTVALAGDGGDELFGGYDRYRAAMVLGRLGIFRRLALLAEPLFPPDGDATSSATRRARFLSAAAHDGYLDLLSIFPSSMMRAMGMRDGLPAWVKAVVWSIRNLTDVVSPVLPLHSPHAAGAMRIDRMRYLPDDILRKTDTASMAVALEVRAPFLDPALARAAMSTSAGRLMRGGSTKALLRALARRKLPAAIVDRPKAGFALPIGEWFRSDYGGLRTLLADHLALAEPFGPAELGLAIPRSFVDRLVAEHMANQRDHGQRLFALTVLMVWANTSGRNWAAAQGPSAGTSR